MKFYRNNWYYVGGIIFVLLAIFMALFGEHIDPVRRIMIVAYMGLLIHQFEEYAFPGGFPMVWNIVQSGETKIPERYPMNKNTSFIANVGCMYLLHILSIIFSDNFLLGLIVIYFSLTQIFIHGIAFNIKMKRLYNPGMASLIFVLYPVGIYYIWYIATNYSVPDWYWWGAAILLVPVAFICLMFPIKKLADRNSPYEWSEDERNRFNVYKKMGLK